MLIRFETRVHGRDESTTLPAVRVSCFRYIATIRVKGDRGRKSRTSFGLFDPL